MMAYNIWVSIQARDVLKFLQSNDIDIHQQIQETLHRLSIEQENFITGAPQKNEGFIVGEWKIYYRVVHKLQAIDLVKITKLP